MQDIIFFDIHAKDAFDEDFSQILEHECLYSYKLDGY